MSLGEPEREARCRARYCSQSDLTNTEELREGSGDGKVMQSRHPLSALCASSSRLWGNGITIDPIWIIQIAGAQFIE